MDQVRFDHLLRTQATRPSRRIVLAGLTGGLFATLPLALRIDETEAKHKGKSEKRKKHKKHKKPVSTSPALPTSPPPPAPVTTADAICHATSTTTGTNAKRFAQSFLVLRSGQLTTASVVLLANSAGAAFVLEIRAVDAAGTPTTVLASTTIANLPATTGGQERTITGVFTAPATVVAGQRYALSVTETPYLGYSLQVSTTDPCPDGNLFVDLAAIESFTSSADGDMMFDTFVTA